MKHQVVNKTDEEVEFCGEKIPANTSTTIHASFVKEEDLANAEIRGGVIFIEATENLSDEEAKKVTDAEALSKATENLSDEEAKKVTDAVASGVLALSIKTNGELTVKSAKALAEVLKKDD